MPFKLETQRESSKVKKEQCGLSIRHRSQFVSRFWEGRDHLNLRSEKKKLRTNWLFSDHLSLVSRIGLWFRYLDGRCNIVVIYVKVMWSIGQEDLNYAQEMFTIFLKEQMLRNCPEIQHYKSLWYRIVSSYLMSISTGS